MNRDIDLSLRVLCGSESRFRLFRALFGSPGGPYHLRGLAEAAGVDPAQVHRLLPRLVGEGLCERVDAHPHPKYRGCTEHPLFTALTNLFSDRSRTAGQAGESPMKRIEERSLALHVAAVRRLQEDPRALQRARRTLERWIARYG
ncbi:MAG: helix-turn-helix domain-containing protein, partial [Terriglobales bacterium]